MEQKNFYKTFFRIYIALVLQQMISLSVNLADNVMLGAYSAIAANSVASNLYMMMKSMAIGAASTASILIGKAIGMGDMKIVELYSKRLQKMFVVIGLVAGIILYFVRIPILNLYELSDATREMADAFLVILSVIIVFMSFVVKASPIVVVCCLNADQVFKCIPAFIKVNYGQWAKTLTRS